jgi:hypothetical protein
MGNFKSLPFFNLFTKRRKTRGTMWASLLGLGISAALYGFTRGKRKDITLPIQNIMKNFSPKGNPAMMSNTALAEFSQELLASAQNNDKKQ